MTGSEQMTHAERAALIRDQNDRFRKQGRGGQLMLTSGIMAKSDEDLAGLLQAIVDFDAFDPDNDPHGEHDFGSLTWQGEPVFWKIDYYDSDLLYGSPDPANPDVTTRVLTVMMAWEY
jgi:hypothetical protein